MLCSKWLSGHQIAMGTKCNKLLVYDINNQKMDIIPNLGSSEPNRLPEQTGIHTIEINPSRTMLATSGQNSKDLAVYRLPTLDPICIGENAHKELIYDVCWLDDEFLVSSSNDGVLGLWRIDNDLGNNDECEFPNYSIIKPLRHRKCFAGGKIKSVIFNEQRSEIVALSKNTYIHVWDSNKFYQVMSKKLPHGVDSVCLTKREDCSLYAIGSKSHFTLLDPRTLHHVRKVSIVLKYKLIILFLIN